MQMDECYIDVIVYQNLYDCIVYFDYGGCMNLMIFFAIGDMFVDV